MSTDLQTVVDRLAIDDILTAYATAVDSGSFEDLRGVFTADARIDYTATGGIAGSVDEVIAWLGTVLPGFTTYCHFLGNRQVSVDGDAARSRTLCLNPMVAEPNGFLLGIYYNDVWVRGDDGWRISERVLETCFQRPL